MNTTQSTVTNFNAPIGFYRALDAAKLLGVSKSTFWLWVSQKTLKGVSVPQPIKLSAGVTVWKKADIHQFIEQLTAETSENMPTPPRAA